MRQRLISAAVGLPIAVVVLFLYNTVLLNIAMAAVAIMAVYEIFVATKYLGNRGLAAICFIFAAVVPFYHMSGFRVAREAFCFLFILVLFLFMMFNYATIRFEQVGSVFMLTLLLSFSFSCIVFIRDYFVRQGDRANIALFYIVLVFIGAWITDAGAYFIGRFFGKKKLAPHISPKKTIEGAVGGVVCTAIFFVAAALIYRWYAGLSGVTVTIRFAALMATALVCSLNAILGDLAASLIKRECNIKDFGNILPGHGGVLDRFDSIMFVAPTVFILMQVLPVLR